jgi:deoxyhypusine monooxygenase
MSLSQPKLLIAGFSDPSALLKHELAYCLGQMGDQSALSVLESVLKDRSEDPMVRHEVLVFRISI